MMHPMARPQMGPGPMMQPMGPGAPSGGMRMMNPGMMSFMPGHAVYHVADAPPKETPSVFKKMRAFFEVMNIHQE